MDTMEKLRLLNDFETAYGPVRARVDGLPAEALAHTPAEPADAWPVRDHLVHLLEADMMMWYRARAAVAEPGVTVPLWDQEAWRSRLGYGALEPLACLDLAAAVRASLGAGFRAMVGADWSEYWINHPERGRMSLAQVLALYRDHPGAHMAYIERDLADYAVRRRDPAARPARP